MSKRIRKTDKPIAWLPIDSRIFFPFFAPTHIHGIARVFLIVEMTLSVLMVVASIILVFIRVLSG
jgi:hypothetical protein